MQVLSILEIQDPIRRAVSASDTRDRLRAALQDALSAIVENETTSLQGLLASQDIAEQLDVLPGVIASTNGLLSVCDLAANLLGTEKLLSELSPRAHQAAAAYDRLLATPIASGLVPPDVEGALNDARDATGGLSATFADRLGENRRLTIGPISSLLANLTRGRSLALHRYVLTRVALASPATPAALEPADVRAEFRARALAMRDALRSALGAEDRDAVTPTLFATLCSAIYEWETWLLDEGAKRLANAMAIATAASELSLAESLSAGRHAGEAYDSYRHAHALCAAMRSVLLAYGAHDASALADWMRATRLRKGSATLDLARTEIAALPGLTQGSIVEVDGLIAEAEFTPGGPAPRSLLKLVGNGGAEARVLVPHASVDSLGIAERVWVRARGAVYPDGKAGLSGPLIELRRVRRGAGAEDSFYDYALFSARKLFDVRPRQLDIVHSLSAGTTSALNEARIGIPLEDDRA